MTAAFSWTPSEPFDSLGILPIRLRALDGEVIATGVSGQTMVVPAGTYLLCVTLPNGREVIGGRAIKIGASGSASLPTLDCEMRRAFDIASVVPAQPAHPRDGITVLQWNGTLLGHWVDEKARFTPQDELTIGHNVRGIAHGRALDTLLLLPNGTRWLAHVLPYDRAFDHRALASSDHGARPMLVSLKPDRDGLTFHSALGGAVNALFQYVEGGLLAESKRLSLAIVADAASASMLQLVLALYALLRANALATVDASVDMLLELAPDMPDSHIVCAEIRARQGRHEEAVAALRSGRDRGVPWFRSGVGYLLERLRLYLDVDAGPSTFSLLPDDRANALAWRRALQRLADRMNTTSLFTEFDISPTE